MDQSHVRHRGYWMALAFALWIGGSVRADVAPAGVFGDNMVLQRQMAIPVWGKAAPGEQVTVTIAGQSKTAAADKDGKWLVRLDSMEANAGGLELAMKGAGNTLVFKNVLVGEVWLCSGQSNMGLPVSRTANAEAEIAAAHDASIRMSFKGNWEIASPETVAEFSATAYYFARSLRKSLNVPVGLVVRAVGGTSIGRWIPPDVLRAEPDLWEYFTEGVQAEYKLRKAAYDEAVKNLPQGKRVPKPPQEPRSPGSLYSGAIAPLTPFAFRGILWYQGEADWSIPDKYVRLMPMLIRSWRAAHGQGDVPFLFVQLPSFKGNAASRPGQNLAWLRDAQAGALALPNTGMAVTIDIGEPDSDHPKNKQEVGKRLSLLALKNVYRQDVVAEGPAYRSCAAEGNKMRLKFATAASPPQFHGAAAGFMIAGPDRKFVPAEAALDGADVLVWSDAVAAPAAVRYAWINDPPVSLFNAASLPAKSFRTDDWPRETAPAATPRTAGTGNTPP